SKDENQLADVQNSSMDSADPEADTPSNAASSFLALRANLCSECATVEERTKLLHPSSEKRESRNMARGRAPPEDSRCFVCSGCLNNPVVLRCNHRLCWSCVQSYWERTHSLKCPVCLEEKLCKVSLENDRTQMPGSNNGNVFMEKTGDKT
ncbi:nuclear factor 7, ovary-like, partial [Clarias magur]